MQDDAEQMEKQRLVCAACLFVLSFITITFVIFLFYQGFLAANFKVKFEGILFTLRTH